MKELRIADTDVRLLKNIIRCFLVESEWQDALGLEHEKKAALRIKSKLEKLK